MKPQQVVDKEFLGHICTAMMLNEMEIISWCYNIYLILSQYDTIESHVTEKNMLKFNNPEELVIACALFAKFVTNDKNDQFAREMIKQLKLQKELIEKMFDQIEVLIDDPITLDAFYLEMRQANDPTLGKHAEDYNLMVSDMVKGSQVRNQALPGQGFTPSLENMVNAPYRQ